MDESIWCVCMCVDGDGGCGGGGGNGIFMDAHYIVLQISSSFLWGGIFHIYVYTYTIACVWVCVNCTENEWKRLGDKSGGGCGDGSSDVSKISTLSFIDMGLLRLVYFISNAYILKRQYMCGCEGKKAEEGKSVHEREQSTHTLYLETAV